MYLVIQIIPTFETRRGILYPKLGPILLDCTPDFQKHASSNVPIIVIWKSEALYISQGQFDRRRLDHSLRSWGRSPVDRLIEWAIAVRIGQVYVIYPVNIEGYPRAPKSTWKFCIFHLRQKRLRMRRGYF